MEGAADAPMRALLTKIGGYDLVISEFIRIVDQALPEKVFHRIVPELKNSNCSINNTPVRVQLLGQHPQWVAENAMTAIALGSNGIDLNFGCPSSFVNRNQGGAALLQQPEQLHKIIATVRQAVPSSQPVSAKMRLGWEDKSRCIELAQAIESAGATELTVHARTKLEGYRPPAYWEYIAKIRQAVSLPIIANGEIWSLADAKRCQQLSNCQDLMLGRGALAVPNLAHVVKGTQNKLPWKQVVELMLEYSEIEIVSLKQQYYPARIKQWLKFMVKQYPQADALFTELRLLKQTDEIIALLKSCQ